MSCFGSNLEDSIATLAHEIKNPVSLILANIGVLKMLGDSEDDRSKYFFIMEREANKINDIVNSLISISVGATRFSQIEMSGLIETIVEDRKQAYSDSIEISLSLPEDKPVILGDKLSLEIVLSNIIKNAKESIEAASDNSKESNYNGKIEISATTKFENGSGILHIKIDDNGAGLSDPDKINTKGYTTKLNGSGIGLAICRSIIEQHSGTFKLTPLGMTGCRAEVAFPLYNK